MTESEYREYEALLQSGALTQAEFERQTAGYEPPETRSRLLAGYSAVQAAAAALMGMLIRPNIELALKHMRADDPNRTFLTVALRFRTFVLPALCVAALLCSLAAVRRLKREKPDIRHANMLIAVSVLISAAVLIVWLWMSGKVREII